MKRFVMKIITVLAIAVLTSTTLLSCGEDKVVGQPRIDIGNTCDFR